MPYLAKTTMMVSAIALMMMSSPVTPVSEKIASAYWNQGSDLDLDGLPTDDAGVINALKGYTDEQFAKFQNIINHLDSNSHGFRERYEPAEKIAQPYHPDRYLGSAHEPEHHDFVRMLTKVSPENWDTFRAAVDKGIPKIPLSPEAIKNHNHSAVELRSLAGDSQALELVIARGQVAEQLSTLPPEKWDSYITILQTLAPDKYRTQLINIVSRVPSEKLDSFFSASQSIDSKIVENSRLAVMHMLKDEPVENLIPFVTGINTLVTNLNDTQRKDFIEKMSYMQPEELRQTLKDINNLDSFYMSSASADKVLQEFWRGDNFFLLSIQDIIAKTKSGTFNEPWEGFPSVSGHKRGRTLGGGPLPLPPHFPVPSAREDTATAGAGIPSGGLGQSSPSAATTAAPLPILRRIPFTPRGDGSGE